MKLSGQRVLLIVLGLLLVGLMVWAFLPAPIEVDLGRVERGNLQVTVDHEGKTRVRERYVVSAPVAGRLLRVELHPGDLITSKKTLLAVIEPSNPELLDVRSIAKAVANVKAAEAAKDRAIPTLRSARATFELSQTDLTRTRKLYERGSAAHQELDDAELRLRVTTEDVKSAEFATQIVEFELELARAALLQARSTESGAQDIERFEIRSPVNGRLLRVFQESEAVVPVGERLLEVGDPTSLEIAVDVLSTDAVKIRPGAKTILEHWGGNAPLTGRVRLIEPSGFTKISALGVEEQRVNVIIDIVDPPELWRTLGDAFRVEARIVIWENQDVLKVPAGALFRHGEGWAVFVVERRRAKLCPVKVGPSNGLQTQVLEGLTENETVILHPSDRVKPGVRIGPS